MIVPAPSSARIGSGTASSTARQPPAGLASPSRRTRRGPTRRIAIQPDQRRQSQRQTGSKKKQPRRKAGDKRADPADNRRGEQQRRASTDALHRRHQPGAQRTGDRLPVRLSPQLHAVILSARSRFSALYPFGDDGDRGLGDVGQPRRKYCWAFAPPARAGCRPHPLGETPPNPSLFLIWSLVDGATSSPPCACGENGKTRSDRSPRS